MRLVIKKKKWPDYTAGWLVAALIGCLWAIVGVVTSPASGPNLILILWMWMFVVFVSVFIFRFIWIAITDIFDIRIEKD